MRSLFSHSATLFSTLAIAAIAAACGGATPGPEAPKPGGAPSASAPTPAASTAPAKTAETTPPPPASSTVKGPDAPPPAAAMPEVRASKMGDELKAAGLDINKLGSMKTLKPAEKAKLMPIISKATGYQCNDCHDAQDKKKLTPLGHIGEHMWNDYVAKFKLASGPLFCDSCHDGKHDFLNRKEKEKVSKYMEVEYTQKLSSKEGATNCQSCHGADFEMKIFEKVWKQKR